MGEDPVQMHARSCSTQCSVSVRVRTEDVYSHPDLEFWTCTHCKRRLHRQFWTFWTYFVDVKTSVWVLTETLPGSHILTAEIMYVYLKSECTHVPRCVCIYMCMYVLMHVIYLYIHYYIQVYNRFDYGIQHCIVRVGYFVFVIVFV